MIIVIWLYWPNIHGLYLNLHMNIFKTYQESSTTSHFLCYFLVNDLYIPWLNTQNQETLGYIDISLADVVSNKRINEKFHLIDSKNGRIQIELQWQTS